MSRPTNINYRKIWEKYHNACLLPGIHIHHLDGNPWNNDPNNLLAVTRREHYLIHLEQGDSYEALMLAEGLEYSDQELVKILQENGRRLYKNGKGLGSISKEERIKIGRKSGYKTKELGLGIHGIDSETRKINSAKAGKACKGSPKTGYTGGQATYDLKVGIHSLTTDDRKAIGLKSTSKLKLENRCGFQLGHGKLAGHRHKGKIPCYHPDNIQVTRRVTIDKFQELEKIGWLKGNMARKLAAQKIKIG